MLYKVPSITYLCLVLTQKAYECRKRKVTNAQRDAGILHHAPAPPGGSLVVEGTLYPLLTRLKNDELLSYEWVESNQGPPRKYYRLTEKGEAFLNELKHAWQELNDTVSHLTDTSATNTTPA